MIKKNVQDASQTGNRILTGTSIEGELRSDGDMRIDGRVKGQVNIKGKLVVGEKGHIEGEVHCAYANVAGTIKAKMEVSELLTLQASAKLHGDIITNKLAIEPGAEFTGSCSMGAVVREIQKEGERKAEEESADRKGQSA
jgi:cytoskeletal protein CcmA (bactofilin family)